MALSHGVSLHWAAVMFAAMSLSVLAGAADAADSRRIERSVPMRSGQTLAVSMPVGGALTVEAGAEDRADLVADLGGRDWQETRVALTPSPDGARLSVVQAGGGLDYSTSHRFRLRVPARASVRISSGGGAVSIAGLTGRFDGSIGGGALRLAGLKGNAQLTTGGGEIFVTDSMLDGRVSTGGGDVVLRNLSGGLLANTGGGQVTRIGARGRAEAAARDESRQAGARRIATGGGAIALEDAAEGAILSTGGGDIRVRRAGRFVEAQTGGGDIELGAIDGRVKATTGAGNVRVGLVGSHDVQVRSGNGAVDLVLPAGLNADIDVETGYTRAHGPVRIISETPLQMTDSGGYVSRNGSTPQRFLRGTARAGNGGARINVRTTNGDIRIVRGRVG